MLAEAAGAGYPAEAADRPFRGVAPLHEAGPEEVAFLGSRRKLDALRATRAGAVVVAAENAAAVPPGSIALVASAPVLAYARIAALLHPALAATGLRHPTAVVGDGAEIGEGCEIGPYAVIGAGARLGPRCIVAAHASIGPNCVLGAECRILAHASMSHCLAGDRVTLHPGARVGNEGFGFQPDATGAFITIPQLGRVILGDGVEVGANACIDRGAIEDTVLGAGTRVDNLAMLGHKCTHRAGLRDRRPGRHLRLDHARGLRDAGGTGRGEGPHHHRRPRTHRRPGRGAERHPRRHGRLRHAGRAGAGGLPRRREAASPGERQGHDPPAGRDGQGGMSGQDDAPAEGRTIGTLDIMEVMQAIPHRYPFLLVDRVVEMKPGVSAVGVKNVSINEGYFQGHFPRHPVMPGVLIIESMAQTAGVLVVATLGPEAQGKLVYFMSVEGAKFRRPVSPGDQLRIHVTKERQRGNVWKFNGVAKVDGTTVAEATYTAMILDK